MAKPPMRVGLNPRFHRRARGKNGSLPGPHFSHTIHVQFRSAKRTLMEVWPESAPPDGSCSFCVQVKGDMLLGPPQDLDPRLHSAFWAWAWESAFLRGRPPRQPGSQLVFSRLSLCVFRSACLSLWDVHARSARALAMACPRVLFECASLPMSGTPCTGTGAGQVQVQGRARKNTLSKTVRGWGRTTSCAHALCVMQKSFCLGLEVPGLA